jgi:hypothetical protein
MSTPKSEITSTFLSLIEDRDLCVNLTDEEMTEILDVYLKDSTYLRFKNCKKDLTDHEEYDFHTDTFTADGINKEYILTKYPTDPNSEAITYVCTVNGTTVDYTFDANTQTFTLDALPTLDDEVIVGYNFLGQFNETLDTEEIYILAWGMIVSWRQKILNNHNNMKNRISLKDYTIFSPANLLDKLTTLHREAEREIRNLRVSYSYNGFTGYDQTRST